MTSKGVSFTSGVRFPSIFVEQNNRHDGYLLDFIGNQRISWRWVGFLSNMANPGFCGDKMSEDL